LDVRTHLLNLRGVPDDELAEIRELLSSNGIDYYETPAGNWGISSPSIWLNDDGQIGQAQALLQGYQQQRARQARAHYRRLQQEGRAERLIDRWLLDPWRMLLMVAMIALVLYVSISPFLSLD
jgi:hypothetical protein